MPMWKSVPPSAPYARKTTDAATDLLALAKTSPAESVRNVSFDTLLALVKAAASD